MRRPASRRRSGAEGRGPGRDLIGRDGSSIEAGDLWNLRRKLHDCADGGEVVRLMQGRKRLKFRQVLKHSLCHPHRRGVFEAAVDHAVAEGDDRLLLEQRAPGLNDLARGGAVVEALRG
jgi:hypothetical protein